jgi:hypothetical protein
LLRGGGGLFRVCRRRHIPSGTFIQRSFRPSSKPTSRSKLIEIVNPARFIPSATRLRPHRTCGTTSSTRRAAASILGYFMGTSEVFEGPVMYGAATGCLTFGPLLRPLWRPLAQPLRACKASFQMPLKSPHERSLARDPGSLQGFFPRTGPEKSLEKAPSRTAPSRRRLERAPREGPSKKPFFDSLLRRPLREARRDDSSRRPLETVPFRRPLSTVIRDGPERRRRQRRPLTTAF